MYIQVFHTIILRITIVMSLGGVRIARGALVMYVLSYASWQSIFLIMEWSIYSFFVQFTEHPIWRLPGINLGDSCQVLAYTGFNKILSHSSILAYIPEGSPKYRYTLSPNS